MLLGASYSDVRFALRTLMLPPSCAQSKTTYAELTVSSTRESRSPVSAEEGEGGVPLHRVRHGFKTEVALGMSLAEQDCGERTLQVDSAA